MSDLRVTNLKGRTAGSAPNLPDGAVSTGIITATKFDGDATGLTGTPNLNVGVITATKFVGDGSELGPTFIASGTISNGNTVVINTDGTVSAVSGTGSGKPTVGINTVFDTNQAHNTSATFDSSNNKVVVAYTDATSNNTGMAVVGTVTGTDIEFGTPVQFHGVNTSYTAAVFDSNVNKVVIAYVDGNNSSQGTAIVGTVSGNAIDFTNSTETVFPTVGSSPNQVASEIVGTFDPDTNKVIFVYNRSTTSTNGELLVGTVSGDTITFGTPVDIPNASAISEPAITYDSNSDKIVIAYETVGTGADNLRASIVTVDGPNNTVSVDGTTVITNYNPTFGHKVVFDSTNNKLVFIYSNGENSRYGTAVVGTISGTSIIFGTPVIFESADTSGGMSAVYDPTTNKVVIVYRDIGNSGYGTVIDGTVTGNDITFGPPIVFESATITNLTTVLDSNSNKVVAAYLSATNSDSNGIVITPTNLSTNLTTENYIGIAAEAIADGASGKISIVGAINSSQTGLTPGQKYYANPTGGLSLEPIIDILNVPGVPVVIAGNSVSATSIIVNETPSHDVLKNSSSSGGGSSSTTSTSSTRQIIASGTLANGDAVVLNSDGTVSSVSGVTTTTPASYSDVELAYTEAGSYQFGSRNFYCPEANVVISTFYNGYWIGNNFSYRYLYAIGKVVGESIEYGPPYNFPGSTVSGSSYATATNTFVSYDIAQSAVVFAYSAEQYGDNLHITAGQFNASKDRITWGTTQDVLSTSFNEVRVRGLVYDPNAQKTVLLYSYTNVSGGNSYGAGARVVTVTNGDTISLGADTTYYGPTASDSISSSEAVYDISAQSILVYYGTNGNDAFARTMSISGTTITFNTATTLTTNGYPWRTDNVGGQFSRSHPNKLVYDETAQKSILSFYYVVNTNVHNQLLLLSVSGTTVSEGSAMGLNYLSSTQNTTDGKLCYNPSIGKCVLFHNNFSATPYHAETSIITITGSTISIGNTSNSDVHPHGIVYDPVSKYMPQIYQTYGRLFDVEPETTNLTSDNFIGFSDGAYTNGQTATIRIVGSIDNSQTGLSTGKKYYVKKNGDLSLNGNTTPLVFAGTALSSTEIIVKG